MKTKQKQTPSLTWQILRLVPAYLSLTEQCQLFLHDKLLFVTYPNPSELLKNQTLFRNANRKTNFYYKILIVMIELTELFSNDINIKYFFLNN